MLARQTRIGLWIAALLTAIMGIVNVLSAVTPGLPDRVSWLRSLFPFEIRAGGHLFAAISGFLLLMVAVNLLRRKRIAWLLAIVLLVISILSHLVKGLDYEECLLAGVLLVQLLGMRDVFTAQSDRPSITQGIRALIAALLFTLAYGTVGFYLLEKGFSVDTDLMQAAWLTLTMFFEEDNAAALGYTRGFPQFFADSIEVIGAVTLSYAAIMLLRPVLLRSGASSTDRAHARAIVEQHGRSSLARFALFDDKAYYFSPSGQSVIAYVAKGRGAIVLGDPIGPIDDRREVLIGFQQFCNRNDWYPAFYQTLPDDLELYQSLGFQALQIGQEAIVDLKSFTLEGKAGKKLRSSINKLTKQGYRVEFHQPPISSDRTIVSEHHCSLFAVEFV